MTLSVNLHAKERRGAKLIVTKKDGGKIEGELIAVKEDSLLILTKWSGRDESIDIADIKVIEIEKMSKGALYGALFGGCVGALIFALGYSEGDIEGGAGFGIFIGTIFGAPAGALIGAIIGPAFKWSKTIHFGEMTDSEIQETLDKLRKKARVRDYK